MQPFPAIQKNGSAETADSLDGWRWRRIYSVDLTLREEQHPQRTDNPRMPPRVPEGNVVAGLACRAGAWRPVGGDDLDLQPRDGMPEQMDLEQQGAGSARPDPRRAVQGRPHRTRGGAAGLRRNIRSTGTSTAISATPLPVLTWTTSRHSQSLRRRGCARRSPRSRRLPPSRSRVVAAPVGPPRWREPRSSGEMLRWLPSRRPGGPVPSRSLHPGEQGEFISHRKSCDA